MQPVTRHAREPRLVYDVWDSAESFEKFGETLMPILAQIGLDPGQPEIMPLHNMIQ
jgi:hypothetical protein